MSENILEEFKRALSSHDWYYDYSDDHTVWRRGRDSASRIQQLRHQLEQSGMKAEADTLYARYSK